VGHGGRTALLQWQAGLSALQRLHLALLVAAQHQRVFGRRHVQAHDVLELLDEPEVTRNLLDLLANTAFVGMLASGLLVVLVAGSIDISFTATASIAQYLAILAAGHAGVGLVGTVSIACVIGTLLGMLNAWLVWVLRMSSIIVSIAMLNVYFGLLMLFSNGQQIFSMPDWFPDALSWVVGTAPNGDPYVLNPRS
jgi:predicted ABC-type sugar transport system permease subunit